MTEDITPPLHLKKLCVGIKTYDELAALMAARGRNSDAADDAWFEHVTRMTPKRADEILNGGSLYWVINGQIVARQRVLALRSVVDTGKPACAIRLSTELIPVVRSSHRPFQGWRYLEDKDRPRDLSDFAAPDGTPLPPEFAAELEELGIL